MFSAGDFLGAPGTEFVTLNDPGLGIYKKLVIAKGRLVGAVLFGDTGDGLWYLELSARAPRSKPCATTWSSAARSPSRGGVSMPARPRDGVAQSMSI